MGTKIRNLVAVLILVQATGYSQDVINFSKVDSLTYKYYLNGSWDSLIITGKDAIGQNIDYKFLRQRIGFAFFSRSQYDEAQKQFTKALAFDSFDSFSLKYLYLSYLYGGNDDAASLIAGKMNKESREDLKATLFKPIESIQAEYNFKYAGTSLRSNPQYFNIGLTSRIGSRLSLFQMFANYSQTITVRYPRKEMYNSDQQSEYYALVKFSFSPNLKLKTAYHFLNANYSMTTSSAHLGYVGFSADYQVFKLGTEFSFMNIEDNHITQAGLIAGLKSTGRSGFYMTGGLSVLMNADSVRSVIYDQKAGIRLSSRMWLEGNVTFGNLSDFSEFSAMYIYNTIDPTSFRCGSTLFLFPGSHISFWLNCSYERKDFYENINYHYNQFSYLAGIKWKI